MDSRFFITIIPLLGLIVGYLLRKIAPEELQPGARYFLWLRRIILIFLTAFLLLLSPFSLSAFLAFIIGFALSFMLRVRYLYLGLAQLAAITMNINTDAFFAPLLAASLIFLYGLPFGSQRINRSPVRAIMTHSALYFLPFVLLLAPVASWSYLPPFVAGALFLRE